MIITIVTTTTTIIINNNNNLKSFLIIIIKSTLLGSARILRKVLEMESFAVAWHHDISSCYKNLFYLCSMSIIIIIIMTTIMILIAGYTAGLPTYVSK